MKILILSTYYIGYFFRNLLIFPLWIIIDAYDDATFKYQLWKAAHKKKVGSQLPIPKNPHQHGDRPSFVGPGSEGDPKKRRRRGHRGGRKHKKFHNNHHHGGGHRG